MKIAVVGAGIAGLVSAFMLARAGHAVTVFEKDKVGSGASGKALGVLVPISLDRPVDVLQRKGVVAWPELAGAIARFGGVAVEEVFREWGDGKCQLRLPLLFSVLKEAIERLGGHVREGCGEVSAKDLPGFEAVILAAGWGTRLPMKISAGQALRLRPPAPFKALVAADKLFVAPDWDGTVLVGSENWKLDGPGDGKPRADITEELMRRVAQIAPELAESEVLEAWVGYRPVSDPRLPLLREICVGVWGVAGLGKVGMALAPMVGKAVLEIIK